MWKKAAMILTSKLASLKDKPFLSPVIPHLRKTSPAVKPSTPKNAKPTAKMTSASCDRIYAEVQLVCLLSRSQSSAKTRSGTNVALMSLSGTASAKKSRV